MGWVSEGGRWSRVLNWLFLLPALGSLPKVSGCGLPRRAISGSASGEEEEEEDGSVGRAVALEHLLPAGR